MMVKHPLHVLLVEDDHGDARLIREMLLEATTQPIVIDLASTFHAGVEQLASNQYNLILLDLSLSDSHGIDTLLNMASQASNIPIVVLTGLDDEAVGIQAVQMGAQDYLPKSDVDGKLLMRSMQYAIERYQSEMAIRKSEEEYRSLINDVFHTSMVAVLILDKDFHVVWCNAATTTYFDIDPSRLIGKDKRNLIDEELKCIFDDPENYATKLREAYATQNYTDRFECQVLPAEHRQRRWLEHWSQPINTGMYAGGRIEQYMDITDRKLLEFREKKAREFAEVMHDIAQLLTSTLQLDNVLERILDNIDQIVPHDSAAITMRQNDGFHIARYWSKNERAQNESGAKLYLSDNGIQFLDQVHHHNAAISLDNILIKQQEQITEEETTFHSYVGAPIELHGETIGFIHLFSIFPDFYRHEDAERLSVFARLAAIAIQNAQLFERSKELATLEERQRLARDLHDSVSQTLFITQTMAESAVRRWERNPDQARSLVENVYDLTKTALAEMRILLLELRPASLTQISLKHLFEQYLRPIQDRRQFDLAIQIDNIAPLPPEVQIAFYRIAQEALNNIHKHAQAKNVTIRVSEFAERVELEITDDGSGFDTSEVTPALSLGLGIMRERAQEIGATIDIQSQRNQGTHITLDWAKPGVKVS